MNEIAMRAEQIKAVLTPPPAYYPAFVDIAGSLAAGIILSRLFYWSSRTSDKDGWIWKTQQQWYEETRLKRFDQESARIKLVTLGLIEEVRKGRDGRMHFRIRWDNLQKAIAELAEKAPKTAPKQRSGMRQSDKPDCGRVTNRNVSPPHTPIPHNKDTANDTDSCAPAAPDADPPKLPSPVKVYIDEWRAAFPESPDPEVPGRYAKGLSEKQKRMGAERFVAAVRAYFRSRHYQATQGGHNVKTFCDWPSETWERGTPPQHSSQYSSSGKFQPTGTLEEQKAEMRKRLGG